MAIQDDFNRFWADPSKRNQAIGGMLDLGVGMYGMNAGRKEADQRLREAQGPLYDQAMTASAGALGQAGSMDPQAFAKQRFDAQRGLLSGVDAKSEADLMRQLHAKGLLGVANYNPGVEGIAPGTTAMNPHMAAFYAARNARDAKMSADSLDAGQAQIDRYLKRSGMLQDQAGRRQDVGLQAQSKRSSPAAANMNLLRGAAGILKDSGLMPGMISTGKDWLGDLFNGNSFRVEDFGDLDFGDGWF
jgi:hypothetical protein